MQREVALACKRHLLARHSKDGKSFLVGQVQHINMLSGKCGGWWVLAVAWQGNVLGEPGAATCVVAVAADCLCLLLRKRRWLLAAPAALNHLRVCMRLVRTWLALVSNQSWQSRLQHDGPPAWHVQGWMLQASVGCGFGSVGCSCGPHARFKRLARSGVYTARCKLLRLYQSCHLKYVVRSGAR